jgi:hypothetical protein
LLVGLAQYKVETNLRQTNFFLLKFLNSFSSFTD